MRCTSSPMVVPQPWNSWPSDIGTASCRCVRPIFSTRANSSPFAKNACCRRRSAVEVAAEAEDQREPQGRRVGVVGGLAEVDVVVRVDVLVVALRVPEQLERDVGDHLVGVHVGRGARAALDEVGHELVEQVARDQPVARRDDRVRDPRVDDAEIAVGHRRGLLHVAEGLHEAGLGRHRDARDVEVLLAAKRLHAVIRVVREVRARRGSPFRFEPLVPPAPEHTWSEGPGTDLDGREPQERQALACRAVGLRRGHDDRVAVVPWRRTATAAAIPDQA